MTQRRRFPIATILFIFACIGAAFAAVLQPDIVAIGGFVPARPSILTAFLCLFLHLNVLHLLGNMLFLAAVGPAVEICVGTLRFTLVYIAGGLFGVLVHKLMSANVTDPLIGASGCVAACIGYFTTRYFNLRVPVAPKKSLPVLFVILTWLLLQVAGAMITIGEQTTSVGYWAHLGGFFLGLLLSLVFGAPQLAEIQLGHAQLEEMTDRSPAAQLSTADHVLKRHPNDVRALRERAEALAKLGDSEHETDCLLRLIELTPESQQPEFYGRLATLGSLATLSSSRRAIMADQVKSLEPELCRQLLLSIIGGPDEDRQKPDAMLALIGLERATAPQAAEYWVAKLQETYPLEPATNLAKQRGWIP